MGHPRAKGQTGNCVSSGWRDFSWRYFADFFQSAFGDLPLTPWPYLNRNRHQP